MSCEPAIAFKTTMPTTNLVAAERVAASSPALILGKKKWKWKKWKKNRFEEARKLKKIHGYLGFDDWNHAAPDNSHSKLHE